MWDRHSDTQYEAKRTAPGQNKHKGAQSGQSEAKQTSPKENKHEGPPKENKHEGQGTPSHPKNGG